MRFATHYPLLWFVCIRMARKYLPYLIAYFYANRLINRLFNSESARVVDAATIVDPDFQTIV